MNTTVTIPQRNTSSSHRTYGGEIYFSDFDTNGSNESAIKRIESAWRVDNTCKKNCKLRGWL